MVGERRAQHRGAGRDGGPGKGKARGRRRGRDRAPASGEPLTGLHPIGEALAAGRRVLHRLDVRASGGHPGVSALADRARALGVPVRELEGREAERLPSPGVLLEAGPLPELALEELLLELTERPTPRTLVALDGIEDPQNLGAIARVAETAGACGLILTHRNAPPLSAAVSRASAGAIEWLPVARTPNLARALVALRDEGFWALGGDAEAERSVYSLPDRLSGADRVVVLGAEDRGLRPAVAAKLDLSLRIPLGGHVRSLNVAAAAAVLLFELGRRSRSSG